MALIKQAKICFRFLFFFHLGSLLFLKEILRKSVQVAAEQTEDMLLLLFAYSFQTMPKKDVELVTLQILP